MSQEYNQWYWKLYRWCKWKLPSQHYYFKYGIKNLWRWFWVIWKDRDWDQHYYWEITKKKISQMRDLHVKNMKFVDTPREIERMNVVLKLIDKVQEDTYRNEYYDEEYFENKMRIDENGHVQFDVLKDELHVYIAKYPSAYRKVMNDPKRVAQFRGEVTNFKVAMLMSIERHNKARRILFKILENYIEGWWD
jgi:hypothetical protein